MAKTRSLSGSLTIVNGLSGRLTVIGGLSGKMEQIGPLVGNLATPSYPMYNGSYYVEAETFEDHSIPTQDKTMMYDLTIGRIPFMEMYNESNGKTLVIGKESFDGV